jgi:hypothetical protein
MALIARLRDALAHRRLPLALAAIAVVLSLPTIGLGFVADDYVLRAVGLGRNHEVAVAGSRFDMFTFFSDAPGDRFRQIDAGWSPWWTGADLRVRFFRPLSSLSHWLDFQIWPSSPLPMHLENIALYAGVVFAVTVLYRRLIGPTWVAGLAAAFYALDPGHAQSSSWISGRNTLLAVLFGVLALHAHDRGRRDGWKPGAPLSAALFAASLLSGESGLSAGLYLFAYAICLDPAPSTAKRLRALAPHALVGVAWVVAYKLLDYGARGSDLYTDPGHDPLRYLRTLGVRAPIYLLGQLALPPASIFAALSVRAVVGLAIFGALFCALFARLSWPVLRADPVARFFALGMILSVLPIYAILPNDRVLFFIGLGGFGLVARFIAASLARTADRRAPIGHRVLAWFFLIVHGLLALPLHLASGQALQLIAQSSRVPLDEILLEPAVSGQTVMFVNAPVQFFISHLAPMRLATDKPIPLRWRSLAPGIYPIHLMRLDARSIAVRVEGGLLQTPGTWNVEGEPPSPPIHPSYSGQHFAQLMRRADDPMRAGDTLALTGTTVEVREVTADGRPVEVRFTFAEPLDSPSLRWLAWDHGRFVDFALPAIGATVKLAPASLAP